MKQYASLCIACLIFLQACSKPAPGPTEVFHLQQLDSQQILPRSEGGNFTLCTEHYVVQTPPSNKAAFQQLVQTHGTALVKKKHCDSLIREYYRSHEKLNKDYQEDRRDHFFKDDIESHYEQLLMSVTYGLNGSLPEYTFHPAHQAYQELFQEQS
ncbi:hypothetical protein V8J88_21010 [Massilia sp. W12]|uniref:hypothetical protein n=1 Tax=Massilia sp. W12 TaxID=3126507 RepID=UPI0030D108EC